MPTVEELQRQVEELRREKEALQARIAPTRFLDYIRAIEQHMYMTFSIEPDSSKQSTVGTTAVEGKFYPQHFQPWTDFQATHETTFAALASTFGDRALFRSIINIEDNGRELSPVPADELDLRPFIRASIEKPAATVVSKYLDLTGDETLSLHFRNNAYGLQLDENVPSEQPGANDDNADDDADDGPPPKRVSPQKTIGVPDRWLFARHRDGRLVHALVGEYKAAHGLTHTKLSRVMSAPPGDSFFLRAVKQNDRDPHLAAASGVPGDVYVAKVISQAYHYMITSGLEFGYVASGDGLVFLRVLEDDPDTLYYFWSVFPVDRNTQLAMREPRETAMAYLATLCMCAIRSTARPLSWIHARDEDLKRWPTSKKTVASLSTSFSLRPHGGDDDDDGGGGGGGGGAGGRSDGGGEGGRSDDADGQEQSGSAAPRSAGAQSALKRPRDARGGQRRRPVESFIVEPPTLPYCTQACLRGLRLGLPLDGKCPNVALHRAARGSDDDDGDNHPLTMHELHLRTMTQLANNMDKDCECLDVYGCFGRHGVLFKLTVTGFGYTFVGKAVQAVHKHVLLREGAVYTALHSFQGYLIPAYLGLIELFPPIPLHSCTRVAYMMLLSYAGPDLLSKKALPAGIDFDEEGIRTEGELEAAGLYNEDVREANLAWNEEVGRVMQIDFDQAHVWAWAVGAREAEDVREDVQEDGPAEGGPAGIAETAPAEPPRSPLAVKRDLNAPNGSEQTKKRPRVV